VTFATFRQPRGKKDVFEAATYHRAKALINKRSYSLNGGRERSHSNFDQTSHIVHYAPRKLSWGKAHHRAIVDWCK
jgi:hypothetical protein